MSLDVAVSEPREHTRRVAPERWPLWVVSGLTVTGLLLRLPSYNSSLFGDEISTYFIVTGHDVGRILQLLHSNQESTPPLYFLLAWMTQGLSHSPQSIRLPSLVAGVATIPLTYLFGLRTVGRRAALVGAALVTLSPYMIAMSTEARAYMVMCFFALASSLALVRALDTGRVIWWITYAASSCAAVYSHFTVVFVLAAQLIWALWTRPQARRALLLANGGAVLGFLPWFGGFVDDLHKPNHIGGYAPFTFTTVRSDLESWPVGTNLLLRQMPGDVAIVLITVGVVTAVIGILEVRRRRGRWVPSEKVVLVVVLALASPLGTIVWSSIGHDVFDEQNLIASWPALAVAIGFLVTRPPPLFRFVAVALVLVGFAIGGAKMLSSYNQAPNVDAAAAFIEQAGRCGDPIVAESIFAHPLTEVDVGLADVGPMAQRCHPIVRLGVPPLSEELSSLAGPHGQPLSYSAPPEPPQVVAQEADALARNGTVFLVVPTGAPITSYAYFPSSTVTQFLVALHAQFHAVRQVKFSGFAGTLPESVYILRR